MMNDEATVDDGLKKGPDHIALMRSNDFNYHDVQWQDKCPFASHIRKTRPRGDHLDEDGNLDDTHAIVRRGIPYGPKTQRTETNSGVSMHDRGLLFVSYQSNLRNGFRHMQKGKFTGYYSQYQIFPKLLTWSRMVEQSQLSPWQGRELRWPAAGVGPDHWPVGGGRQ